ncbi:hypothetical protein B5F87_02535 [Eubacterium sp. An3]|nr:hypothetical protein B5F87_02535 [Eubacterium sp. An3]
MTAPDSSRMNFMAKPERKQLKNKPREKHIRPKPQTFFIESPSNCFLHFMICKKGEAVRIFIITECILEFLFFIKKGILYPKMRPVY